MYKLSSMIFLAAVSGPALAATPLGGDQIRKLVSGNTVSLHSVARGDNYLIYYAPDGSAVSRSDSNGTTVKGVWRITDSGEWCNHWKGGAERCGNVIDNGDGTFNRLENGRLRSVWKQIHPGNTLDK